MEAVNAFPANWVAQRQLFDMVQGKSREQAKRLLGPAYAAFIDSCPEPIKRYIGPLRSKKFDEIELDYGLLERARALLGEIADLNASNDPGPHVLSNEGILTIAYLDRETGQLQIHTPQKKLLEGIDTRRIRRCNICSTLYWAGRVDQRCCGTRCAHKLRSRNYRRKHPHEFKRGVPART